MTPLTSLSVYKAHANFNVLIRSIKDYHDTIPYNIILQVIVFFKLIN